MGIEIICNGEPRQTESRSVAALLKELDLAGRRVAVELNKNIVPRSSYEDAPLQTGDLIEIVHFVGGG